MATTVADPVPSDDSTGRAAQPTPHTRLGGTPC